MRAADQPFQLFGRAEARRRREEARYVVAERTVVGVLGYGHQLHGVVAVAFDDGQNRIGELAVGAYAGLLLRHAYVGLVDEQFVVSGDVEGVVRPVEGTRNPELRREILRPLVLHDARGVGRYAVEPAVAAVDVNFIERPVLETVAVHGVGQEDAPDSLRILVEPQFGALPVVEIAEEIDVVGAGQPFAEPPAFERCVVLPAEIPVAVGVVDERSGCAAYLAEPLFIGLVTGEKLLFDRTEPLVTFDHFQTVCIFHRSDVFGVRLSFKYTKNLLFLPFGRESFHLPFKLHGRQPASDRISARMDKRQKGGSRQFVSEAFDAAADRSEIVR